MSHRVQAVTGVRGLTLPGGWELNGGDTVVVSDTEWTQIASDVETLGRLVDLGSTTDLPDPVPTWRDIQRATAAGPTGLEAEVAALNAELGAHEARTTSVHGIDDTALLETHAGAQTRADSALAAALAALSTHAADTTNVHGISDTALLETLAGAQAKADAAKVAAEAYALALHSTPPPYVDTIDGGAPAFSSAGVYDGGTP